jgi:glycerate kinase
MKIVVAPDSFKESLTAPQVCEAIARGVRTVWPDAEVDLIPLADGGEGTVDALVSATGGEFQTTHVFGPLGASVDAVWGQLGSTDAPTAVIEMSAASGLMQVPPDRRDPLRTTTFGTGELIRAAFDHGARKIIMGIGGSATNDGGVGAAQALGVTFCNGAGEQLRDGLGGGDLADIQSISVSFRDPRIAESQIVIACDVDNPLCGPRGASAIYGPQKGATPDTVAILDRHLAHLAALIERDLGKLVADVPGAGAAGGLGAGMLAFADGELCDGITLVMEAVRFQQRIQGADLVITGEGRLDAQSMMGKLIGGVGRAAQQTGVPVIAIVGSAGDGADESLQVLDAYHALVDETTSLEEAIAHAASLIERRTAQVMSDRR